MSTIVVPTDFSRASHEAIRRAAGLALLQSAELRVIHGRSSDEADVRSEHERDAIERLVASVWAQWLRERHVVAPSLPVRYEAIEARSAQASIDRAIEAFGPSMIVMATHGGLLLGESLAQRIATRAPCDVVVIHAHDDGEWPLRAGPIVVGVDFSPSSRRALAVARSLQSGPVHAVHVVSDSGKADDMGRALADFVDGMADEIAVQVHGSSADGLIEFARLAGAGAVAVGSTHRTGFARLGDVASRVIRRCCLPVLVTKATD